MGITRGCTEGYACCNRGIDPLFFVAETGFFVAETMISPGHEFKFFLKKIGLRARLRGVTFVYIDETRSRKLNNYAKLSEEELSVPCQRVA